MKIFHFFCKSVYFVFSLIVIFVGYIRQLRFFLQCLYNVSVATDELRSKISTCGYFNLISFCSKHAIILFAT